MNWKYLNVACAGAVIGCLASHHAIAGMGGGGMQGGNFQGAGGGGAQGFSNAQVSSAQVTGAQFSASRVGAGQSVRSGGSGYGIFSAPVRQAPQTSAYPYAYVHRGNTNDSGFGTDAHVHRDAHDAAGGNPSSSGALTDVAGRTGFNSSAPFHPGLAPPVVLDPNPQAAVSRTALVGSPQNPAAVPGRVNHPSNPAPAFHGIAGTANSALTRANQWRHDPGHPHHHRHFVYLNDSVYLLDEGIYDDTPDFSVSPDMDSSTYEDGYYDTFDSSTVGAVQTRLASEGYYNGVIDSKMKPDVRDAIAKYQQEHGMSVTGVIDEPLLKELGML
ncbi:MAG: peptidoglycan-binding domain-containing protein [Chthoniobacteraceae bacterium]